MALDEQDMKQIAGLMEQLFTQHDAKVQGEIDRQVSEKVGVIANSVEGMLKSSGDAEGQDGSDVGSQIVLAFLQNIMGNKAQQPQDMFGPLRQMAEMHTLTRQVFIDPMNAYMREGQLSMAKAIEIVMRSGQDVDISKIAEQFAPAPTPATAHREQFWLCSRHQSRVSWSLAFVNSHG